MRHIISRHNECRIERSIYIHTHTPFLWHFKAKVTIYFQMVLITIRKWTGKYSTGVPNVESTYPKNCLSIGRFGYINRIIKTFYGIYSMISACVSMRVYFRFIVTPFPFFISSGGGFFSQKRFLQPLKVNCFRIKIWEFFFLIFGKQKVKTMKSH